MKTLVVLMSAFICVFVILITAIPDKQTHWGTKNCELSEISPDFTPQQKADCRIMRSKK
jgi:hypothetical protein